MTSAPTWACHPIRSWPSSGLSRGDGPRGGGGFLVAPQGDPRDGLLNFAMVEYVSRLMMFRLIPEFMRGTHGRFRQVHLGTFRRMELKADRPLLIHTGGEH